MKGLTLWKFVSDDVCVCMFYVCEVIGFVDWLDRGLINMWEEFRNVYLLVIWVWLSWGDPVWLTGSNYYYCYLCELAWLGLLWSCVSATRGGKQTTVCSWKFACLFISVPQLNHPVLGEKVGCVTQCWVRRWGVSPSVGWEGGVCHPVLGEKVECVTQCWVRRWSVSPSVGWEGGVCHPVLGEKVGCVTRCWVRR